MKACSARHTHYTLCHNLTTNTNLIHSPDGESLAGEAGISTGSDGVAIHGKDTQRSLKTQASIRAGSMIS